MHEGEERPHLEIPRSPQEVLRDVGLTPERLPQGRILTFGEAERLVGIIPDAQIDNPLEIFLENGEVIPEGEFAVLVIGVNSPYFRPDPTNEDCMELLQATLQALDEKSGEIRIAEDDIDAIPEGGRQAFSAALAERLGKSNVEIVAEKDARPYMVIKQQ